MQGTPDFKAGLFGAKLFQFLLDSQEEILMGQASDTGLRKASFLAQSTPGAPGSWNLQSRAGRLPREQGQPRLAEGEGAASKWRSIRDLEGSMAALAGAGGMGTSDLPAAPATGKAPVPWPFQ